MAIKNKTLQINHRKIRKYITEDEFDYLLKYRPKSKREGGKRYLRYRSILMLLYYHGLRRGELVNLKWEDINFSSSPPSIFIKRLKNGKSNTHPLIKGEKAFLEKLYDISLKKKYVIENPDGRKIDLGTINKFFGTINNKQILPFHLHPHMLRHGCGYHLVNKGVGLRQIQDYMGHVSIQNTVIYTALSPKKFEGIWD